MFPDNSVAQKHFLPNSCSTCAQIKGSVFQNIRSCHACVMRFASAKQFTREEEEKTIEQFLPLRSPPSPNRIVLAPQFARGQNSKTQSNTRYLSTQSSFFLGYEPAVSPSPAASFKGSPFGQASPTFSVSNTHSNNTAK